ncbi:MAG: bifunctional transaldolase/phosoglucose isomerase, partial [Pseudomonadota bacterium]
SPNTVTREGDLDRNMPNTPNTPTTTSPPTTLQQTRNLGQSIWYDNIRRGLMASGELQALIDQGVMGITSNPTIFEKAIAASSDYDVALRDLVARGLDTESIYEALAVADIQSACDLLLPVYQATGGVDGRVSLEVLPALAANTAQTISEGIRLAALVGRPNVMIKVPATPEGLPAITALTAAGVSVNVTLIFGLDQYREVLDAYVDGIEKRAAAGHPVDDVASVASFFVSRVDSACDKLLDDKIGTGTGTGTDAEKARARSLLGTIAIANAKLAYDIFGQVTSSARWKALAGRGARPQRLLWASTGTKDPRYSDTLYLDGLVGADTVNTVPPATLAAFLDHGKPAVALSQGLPEARARVAALAELGIDLDRICRGLLADGVKSFLASMNNLLGVIAARRAAIAEQVSGRQKFALPGADRAAADAALADLAAKNAPQRLWGGDPTLFTPDPAHEKSIHNRLGWLRAPEFMRGKVAEMRAFVADVIAAGFNRVVLLGMGGSSLGPEVLAHTFAGHATGLALAVLDNTDPAAVRAVEQAGDLRTTLFVVASKSGGTIEIQAFEHYFWARVLALHGGDVARAGAQFVAITDPATRLGQLAEEKHYRKTFINPADIGGRYSALSYFGLLPAALLGADVDALVDGGAALALASSPHLPAREIAGMELGAVLGTLAARGRDKMTLVSDPEIETLGSWIEQLVAESTGKEGKGIVPVDLEPLAAPALYGPDRLFVRMTLAGGHGRAAAANAALTEGVAALERAGYPVVRLDMPRREDLGREFFRWELATAIAGSVLAVNPFDEPNVTEAKLATGALLSLKQQQGKLPDAEGVVTLADAADIRRHVFGVKPGDYVAFCAYFVRAEERDRLLSRLRVATRAKTTAATTLGYGPRFLHSTGQLHKGGPNNGVFVQLTADVPEDLPIPGEAYTFGDLRDAQALGDLQVLRRRGRRAIRVHLGKDIESGLAQLLAVLEAE